MKKTLAAVIMFAFAGALLAQAPADKAKPAAPEKKPAAAPAAAPAPAAAQPAPAPEKKPAARQPAKQVEEPEEAMVMIDDKAEPEGKGAVYAEERVQDRTGIPEAYGPCKGVTTDAGRTILIFENPDSGEITFVQVVFGKTGVTWRLIDSIKRFAGETMTTGSEGE